MPNFDMKAQYILGQLLNRLYIFAFSFFYYQTLGSVIVNSDATLTPHDGRWRWILNRLLATKISVKSWLLTTIQNLAPSTVHRGFFFPSHCGKGQTSWLWAHFRVADLCSSMVVTVWSSVAEFQALAIHKLLAPVVLSTLLNWFKLV